MLPALLAGALTVLGLAPLVTPAAAVSPTEVGPVDNATGYPFWWGDSGGDGLNPVRLELCLDDTQDPLCPVVGDRPNAGAPLSVPENFPDESFWWSAEALIDTPSGARARLVMGQEAAFGGVGDVAVGQQVAFSRLRIRIDGLVAGASYHVTTPYGERTVVADDGGRVFTTEDNGCLSPPCDFNPGPNGQSGPFLRWDEGAPPGYVGDPAVAHTVEGSPTGDNLFRIVGPGLTGPADDTVETDLFTVQGRIAQPRGTVSLPGDLYESGTTVTITSSFPGESDIVYTIDGSDPRTNPATTVPSTGVAVVELPEGPTTLKYVVRSGGQESQVYTETYELRPGLAIVTATPGPAEPDGPVLEGRQGITLTSNQGGRIFYTTDGTRPRIDANEQPLGTTREYTDAITIARSTPVRAFALPDPVTPPDGTEPSPPQAGPVKTFWYVIHNLHDVSTDRTFGYPFSLTDIGLPGVTPSDPRENPVGLELCLDDPGCPVVGDLPDPTKGLSFPDNFPDESFWWSGEAQLALPTGRARLVLALEAAFDSPTVQDDHQVAFGRIRVRMDDMVPLATYEIVHPYGVIRATADDTGRVFYTEDNGCMTGPCGFDALLTQPVGPALRWSDGAPTGYIGDGVTPHTVVGSPYDTNEFVVHQVTDDEGQPITPVLVGETDQFTVQGKLPGPGAIASWQTGLFNHQLDVALTSGGNPLTQGFRYTTDGTDPVTNGQEYDGPIRIEDGTTVLRYVAVGAGGQTSAVEEETYTVDSVAPTLSASPAGGAFDAAQDVTFQTNELADIFFTLDGSTPTQTSPRALGSVRVASSSTLKAIAVDFAGNVSPVRSWDFTITPPPTGGGGTGTGGGGTGTGGGGTGTPAGPAATGLAIQTTTFGPVEAGGATTFSGVLAVNGQALTGAPVVLQTRALVAARPVFSARTPAEAGWVDIATTTTGPGGAYAFPAIRPTATADYRVVFRGDATHGPVVSAVERIQVRGAVSLARLHQRVVERGTRITLRGKLFPAHRGAMVLVTLDGPGRHVDRVRTTVTRRGAWKVTFRAPARTGRWRTVATWRGDVDHLGSSSAARTIRVVR